VCTSHNEYGNRGGVRSRSRDSRPYDLPYAQIKKSDDLDNACTKSLVLEVLMAQAVAMQIILTLCLRFHSLRLHPWLYHPGGLRRFRTQVSVLRSRRPQYPAEGHRHCTTTGAACARTTGRRIPSSPREAAGGWNPRLGVCDLWASSSRLGRSEGRICERGAKEQ
jgi:hypothetical protein